MDFGGWNMPLHYGSQLEEHHAVRDRAGMFDVSHMTVVDIAGGHAQRFLSRLLANDVAKLDSPGRAIYTCMLNESGGVVDDLIVYRRQSSGFRIVVNAATREQDLFWLEKVKADDKVEIAERRDLAMIAVQGPLARETASAAIPGSLRELAMALSPFTCAESHDWFVARTGYTGEDGWEWILPAGDAPRAWQELESAGMTPCGLGARDTLRLEAGLNLYGQDMDQETTPLDAGLGWTVAWEPATRKFIGREALEAQREAGPGCHFVGLVLDGRGIMRSGQRVLTDAGDGEITSGGFSPTMNCSIALARLPPAASGDCLVEIRGKSHNVRIVDPPFVRHGRIRVPVETDDKENDND